MNARPLLLALFVAALFSGSACTNVDSEEDARLAYLGLDQALTRAVQLGFDGFNAASSANIPAQNDDGEESGEMDVSGQVDQGASANKGMRLDVALTEYSDGPIDDPETEDVTEELSIVYDTEDEAALRLEMQLKNIPDGDMSGTFAGTVILTGDIEGELELSLTVAADLEPGEEGQQVQRVEGTTRITGTATSASGEYAVDVTH